MGLSIPLSKRSKLCQFYLAKCGVTMVSNTVMHNFNMHHRCFPHRQDAVLRRLNSSVDLDFNILNLDLRFDVWSTRKENKGTFRAAFHTTFLHMMIPQLGSRVYLPTAQHSVKSTSYAFIRLNQCVLLHKVRLSFVPTELCLSDPLL